MKNSILLFAGLACTSLAMSQSIQVGEQKSTFSTGEQNALTTVIYNNSQEKVVDKWKDFLKDFKNEKVKYDKNELFGDNVLIKEWGNNPVDVYTRFEENKDNKTVKMLVAFDLGGAYLSSSVEATKFALAEKLLKDFAIQTTKLPIEEKLKDAQKILENLENDQKKLEKENKDLHNDIENYKNKISKAEEDSKKNEENQVKARTQIEVQKSAIEQVKKELEAVK